MSGVLTSTLIILLLESFYVIWFMFPSFLDWCFKNVKCYFTCIYKIYVYTCTIVHPLYLLQCKSVYMDYCLSFVAITLVWYSHLFYVIIWYVFNHYVNGKEFSKFCMMYRYFSTPISLPPQHTHTPFTPLLVIAKDFDLLTISQCYCMTVAFQVDTLEVMYVWACDCVYQWCVY